MITLSSFSRHVLSFCGWDTTLDFSRLKAPAASKRLRDVKQTEIVALALVRYDSIGRYNDGDEDAPADCEVLCNLPDGTSAPPQASMLVQSLTVSSAPPEASKAPVPPLYDSDQTGPLCPVSVAILRADPRSQT